jgi:hypothetical protein
MLLISQQFPNMTMHTINSEKIIIITKKKLIKKEVHFEF